MNKCNIYFVEAEPIISKQLEFILCDFPYQQMDPKDILFAEAFDNYAYNQTDEKSMLVPHTLKSICAQDSFKTFPLVRDSQKELSLSNLTLESRAAPQPYSVRSGQAFQVNRQQSGQYLLAVFSNYLPLRGLGY